MAEAIVAGEGGRAGTDADTVAEMWAEAGAGEKSSTEWCKCAPGVLRMVADEGWLDLYPWLAGGDSNAWYNLGVMYAGGGGSGKKNMTGYVRNRSQTLDPDPEHVSSKDADPGLKSGTKLSTPNPDPSLALDPDPGSKSAVRVSKTHQPNKAHRRAPGETDLCRWTRVLRCVAGGGPPRWDTALLSSTWGSTATRLGGMGVRPSGLRGRRTAGATRRCTPLASFTCR